MRATYGSRTTLRVALPVLLACLVTSSLEAQPDPILTVSDATTGVGQELSISIVLDHNEVAQGWSYGMCHDPMRLAIVAADLGADGSIVNLGGMPDWVQLDLYSDGWTVGVVINFIGMATIPAGTFEIGRATYTGLAEGDTTICPCNTLGIPPVATVIVYSGASLEPIPICGTMTIALDPLPEYRNGDANVDGWVDLADPIFIINGLFASGPAPLCAASNDANGDSSINIADGVHLLAYLFQQGAPPVAPFPECAVVPQADCNSFDACP